MLNLINFKDGPYNNIIMLQRELLFICYHNVLYYIIISSIFNIVTTYYMIKLYEVIVSYKILYINVL